MRTVNWRAGSPAVLVITMLTLLGQVVSFADASARPWIFAASIPLLDLAGAVYSFRAARRSPYPMAWRLAGLARTAAVLTTVALMVSGATGSYAWWWAGTLSRLAMFTLLAAGCFSSRLVEVRGRRRYAFLSEIITVLAAGFMLVWYFVLDPMIEGHHPSHLWVSMIGYATGDLLLLIAASTLLLGGAVPRLTHPVAPLVIGMALYLVGDAMWSSMQVRGAEPSASALTCFTLVAACLMLTLSPMLLIMGPQPGGLRRRLSQQPAWSARLPVLALALGGTLMLVVTVRENDMLPWGGLVIGLIVMTAAVLMRQVISLRDSQDLIVSDMLTGLANRTGLDQAIDRAVKRHDRTAMLLIDLDGFKLVNDAYGHAAGDTVLTVFAHQLRSTVRTGDVPARIGGDEFAVLLTTIETPEQAVAAAQRILVAVAANPVRLGDDILPIRASIGVAVGSPDDLLRRADVAMYQAKRAGTHGVVLHDPSMTDRRVEDAALSDDLTHALERDELVVLFQPIVDLHTGRPVSAEALLRWQHPTRGTVSPVRFIPIAERSGIITEIGLYVLERALLQLKAWQSDHPLHISVNLSPRQLQEPTIVHDILAVLTRTGMPPACLVLEVTESAIVDEHTGIAALRVLREHGIRVAIDDFGTGYSSLQYLTRLPVDILKIDRAFVGELNGTPAGSAITEAIIRLSQVLNLTTVAEGIETTEQADELLLLGCDTGQGYLYAKPLPGPDLDALMTTRRLDV